MPHDLGWHERTRDAASSYLDEMYREATIVEPSVTKKFKRLGCTMSVSHDNMMDEEFLRTSVILASRANSFKCRMVSRTASRKTAGENSLACTSGNLERYRANAHSESCSRRLDIF
jgi:hypothetical protein